MSKCTLRALPRSPNEQRNMDGPLLERGEPAKVRSTEPPGMCAAVGAISTPQLLLSPSRPSQPQLDEAQWAQAVLVPASCASRRPRFTLSMRTCMDERLWVDRGELDRVCVSLCGTTAKKNKDKRV